MRHWLPRAVSPLAAGPAAVWILAWLPAAQAQVQEPVPVSVDDTLWRTLSADDPELAGHGRSRVFELVAAHAGPLTVELHSADFDAFLVVEDGGALYEHDDDGGVETDSRIVFTAQRGGRYRIVAAAAGPVQGDGFPQLGEFRLSVLLGEVPALGGSALLDASIVFRGRAAERALDRGDLWGAAWSRLREGRFRASRGQHADAEAALESARELYAGLDDPEARKREGQALLHLGRAAYDTSRPDQALECYEQARALFEALGDDDREVLLWRAEVQVNIGQVREDRGASSEAQSRYEQALAVFDAQDETAKRAWALGKLGNLLRQQGRLAEAQPRLEQQMLLARQVGDPRSVANALAQLGGLYLTQGRLDEARDQFEAWKDLAQEHDLENHLPTAYGNLGIVYQFLGRPELASHYRTRALETAKEAGDTRAQLAAMIELARGLGEHRVQEAIQLTGVALDLARQTADGDAELAALESLATQHAALGDLQHARPYGVELSQRALALERPAQQALALHVLGNIEREAGRYPLALDYYDRAEAICGELGSSTAWIESDRGHLYFLTGELETSLGIRNELYASGVAGPLRLRAVRGIVRCTFGLGQPEKALDYSQEYLILSHGLGPDTALEALWFVGDLYWSLGSPTQALGLYSRSLALRETVQGLWGMGLVHGTLGDHRQSVAFFERALEVLDRPQPTLLANIGHAHWQQGDLERGMEYSRRGLDAAREQRTVAFEAWPHRNLAAMLAKLGRYAESREHALAALALDDRNGDAPVSKRISHWALGRAALAEGDVAAAWSAAQAGEELTRIAQSQARRAGSWGSTYPYLDQDWERLLQDLVVARADGADPAIRDTILAEGFRRASSFKGRHLLGGLVEHRRGERSEALIDLRRRLRQTRDERDDALLDLTTAIGDERRIREATELRREAEERQKELESLTRTVAALHRVDPSLPGGAAPAELRERVLDGRTALVEYAEGEQELFAYVVTKTALELVALGDREAIEASVDRFLTSISTPGALGDPETVVAAGRELHDALLAPALRVAGEGVERIVVVPTRSLSRLPFEALVVRAPQDSQGFADVEFVLDAYEVVHGPSSAVLLEIAAMGPRRRAGKVLLLADPVYPTESAEEPAERKRPSLLQGRSAVDPRELQRLPKTRDEALAIADLLVDAKEVAALQTVHALRRERSGSLSSQLLDMHLGSAASADVLRGRLRAYTVLHLAAHGFVDRELLQGAGIALTWEEGEDGLLAITDVLELDLDADLVVLSACDSARGGVRMGEGVGSMALAFVYAGARSAVASLWQVEDRSAAQTMKGFYEGLLLEDLSPAQALRRAKLAIRRGEGVRGVQPGGWGAAGNAGHPYYWAPFVYLGLPR